MVRSVILKHYQESLRESLKSQRKSQVSSHEAALVRFQNFLLDHMVVVLISIGIYQLFELRSLVVGSWLSCAVGFTKWSVESGQSTSVIFTRCCGEYEIGLSSGKFSATNVPLLTIIPFCMVISLCDLYLPLRVPLVESPTPLPSMDKLCPLMVPSILKV